MVGERLSVSRIPEGAAPHSFLQIQDWLAQNNHFQKTTKCLPGTQTPVKWPVSLWFDGGFSALELSFGLVISVNSGLRRGFSLGCGYHSGLDS